MMKQQEIQIQKAQNVKKIILFIMFVFSINFGYTQTKIEGTYYEDNNPPHIVDGGEYTYYKFYKNGIFKRNTSGELGAIDYGKGHYFIRNDSLILNYDLTELKTNDYHKFKSYINYKDSIKVKITISDMNNKPLPNLSVLNFPNKIDYQSNSDGIIEFSLKRKKEKIELHVVNNYLGYDFSIWADKNYEIKVFLRQDDYSSGLKGSLFKYKIIKLSKEKIKLRINNNFLILKKQSL